MPVTDIALLLPAGTQRDYKIPLWTYSTSAPVRMIVVRKEER